MAPSVEQMLGLLESARSAGGQTQRGFVLLNATREALPYHAAVLWRDGRPTGHSGVGEIDTLGPYARWLLRLGRACAERPAGTIGPDVVETSLREEWDQWWPRQGLWLPGSDGSTHLMLVREPAWTQAELVWMHEWWSLWQLAEQAARAGEPRKVIDVRLAWQRLLGWRGWATRSRRVWVICIALLTVQLIPVRLTVRAAGELVPREPTVLRATVDGMASKLHVEPNQPVRQGDLLAELDDATLASRLQVARQGLATAEVELRQALQQALTEPRVRVQLASARGRVDERRTEVSYLAEQLRRAELRAPHDGVVLIDDPGAWVGRNIVAGEPLLRLARPEDQEIEAWVAPADAIDLSEGTPMLLFLSSRPTSPVRGRLRSYGYEALVRPDGSLGYRLRGSLDEPARERLGARGTVHLQGPRVPLVYWVFRRPLAALREATGW
jgi:hypothetical protein